MAGEDDIRLSLAGAQDKLAIHIANNQTSIPLGGAPSTHILKPSFNHFADVVVNEHLCMVLARAVGLPAAVTEVGAAEGIDYLLVERYDRIRVAEHSIERLHQEDFCQALGIASENKYQNEGGPSLKQCFELIRETSSVPIADLTSLLDAAIFNFLIGNNDAHGKNFSLLYTPGPGSGTQTRLAPFYDMLSTAYYPELSNKMAMKIGGEYLSEKVSTASFDQFAEDAGLSKPIAKRRVRGLAEAVIARLPQVATEHPVSVAVAKLIHERCTKTIHQFAPNAS